jgi:hypothetical protein
MPVPLTGGLLTQETLTMFDFDVVTGSGGQVAPEKTEPKPPERPAVETEKPSRSDDALAEISAGNAACR